MNRLPKASINTVILAGTVISDPVAGTDDRGMAFTTFRLATQRSYKPDYPFQPGTDGYRIVAWDVLAELCAQHLERGQAVYVEGMLTTRDTWSGGKHRSVTEVRAGDVYSIDYRERMFRDELRLLDINI